MSKAAPVVGVGTLGFGVLMIWSAYRQEPLFGKNGLIRQFIVTGSLDNSATRLGSLAGKGLGKSLQQFAAGVDAPKPPNNPPPGSVINV